MGFKGFSAGVALAFGVWMAAAVWSAGLALDDLRAEVSGAKSAVLWSGLAVEELAAEVATLVKGSVR